MKAIQRFSLVAVIACGLGWTIQQALPVADQPNLNPIANQEEIAPSDPAKAIPPATGHQDEQAAMRADPLFQAILQEFKKGREELLTENSTSQSKTDVHASHSITPARWEAVELILRAARILENEEKRLAVGANSGKSTAGIRAAIQLRALALEIIQAGLNP